MEVLPPAALQEVDRMAPMNVARKGTLIMEPGTPREVLYLLKEGRVRIYRMNPEGRQLTTALLGSGNVFGEVGSLSTGTHGAFAEAVEETILCLLRRPDVERLLQNHPQLSLRLIELLSEQLRQTQELMGYLALEDVRSRLLYLLVRLAAEFGTEGEKPWQLIRADLTHQDLASMIGSSRETVSNMISALAREGLVRTGRKEIWINREAARGELDLL
jgi:CRP-like cAMP-binding protein